METATPPESGGPIIIEGIEDEIPDEVLRLELDEFEGPFEVLLYLIKSQEIDIFDIPIVKVTEQYLRFLEMMKDENLDAAGDFLVMAATLIQIKSKMILPIDLEMDEEEEDIEEEDPRLELVEKLLEYRKFRDLAVALGEQGDRAQDYFPRSAKPKIEVDEEEDTELLDITLYDLIKAIRAILRFVTDRPFHEVELEGASVDEKIAFIEELLLEKKTLCWADLVQNSKSKVHLVCCLLAILELCRMRRVRCHQHDTYGEIRLFAREKGEDVYEQDYDDEVAEAASTASGAGERAPEDAAAAPSTATEDAPPAEVVEGAGDEDEEDEFDDDADEDEDEEDEFDDDEDEDDDEEDEFDDDDDEDDEEDEFDDDDDEDDEELEEEDADEDEADVVAT